MNQYKAYEIRREVLTFKADEHTRAILILLEHLDWSTGVKEATNFTHMKNWLYQLSTKYNLDEEAMKNAVQAGISRGWLSLTDNGCTLSLARKPVPSLIEEVPEVTGPVETDEVPHFKRDGWIPLTRERIRELVPCPKCGADAGLLCKGEKKGKHNREANHKERSQAASREAKRQFDTSNT